MFFKGSRYESVETDSITNAQDQVIKFKKVRFIPDTPAQAGVVVNQSERLDHIAQRVYQDPEIFWRICDANLALWPPDLVAEPGRVIKVPPSEITGAGRYLYLLDRRGACQPELLQSIQQIEVEDHANMADMLRLQVVIGVKDGCAGWSFIDDDLFSRLANIRIAVAVGSGRAETLINAYIIETNATFANQPGSSMLNVAAMDPTVLMNLEEKVKPWPNMADSDVANTIFSSPEYKFTPIVDATKWRRQENDQTVIQRGTDIQFLQQLARRNGFEVYVETNGLTGVVEGHFHAPRLDLPPQGVLSVNMRDATNVNSFNARFDMLRPSTAQATNLDVESRENQRAQIGSSRLTALGRETALTAQRPRLVLPSQTGLTRTGELQAYAQAVADQSALAITADGELNTVAYGGLMRAKRPILVRGAGQQFSGTYYVERVHHILTPDSYKQNFTLRRNAVGLSGRESFVPSNALPA